MDSIFAKKTKTNTDIPKLTIPNYNQYERRTLKYEAIFGNLKPFKNDEKCFLFHLKSSFRSQDI